MTRINYVKRIIPLEGGGNSTKILYIFKYFKIQTESFSGSKSKSFLMYGMYTVHLNSKSASNNYRKIYG